MADVGWIKANFPGYQSWNDSASIIADYNATSGSGKGPSTGGGSSSGGGSNVNVNLNEGVTLAQAQRKAAEQLIATQGVQTNDFLNKYGDTIAKQGSTEAAALKIGEQYNLPQLRKTAFDLGSTLESIPEVYKQSTRGTETNANQLARIIGMKQSELAPAYNKAVSNQQFAEQGVNERLQWLGNDWARQLLPLDKEQSLMVDNFARQISLFSESNQSELTAILDKIRNNISISQSEQDRANALAMKERDYENALKLAQVKTDTSPYQTVGEGSTIFNTSTGKAVYTAPKSYAPNTYPNPITPTLSTPKATTNSSTIPGTFDYLRYVQ